MKQIVTILFLSLASTSYSQIYSSKKHLLNVDSLLDERDKMNEAAVGKPFPEFHIYSNNTEFSNSSIKGKVVFVNFWFSACPPCIAEFEELNKLYKDFKDNKNFDFVSFTYEDSLEIEAMRRKYHIPYKIFSIPRNECRRLNMNNGFPTNTIVDKTGSVKYIHVGGEMNNRELKRFFKSHYYPLIFAAL